MSATPQSEQEQYQRDEEAAQEVLTSMMDTSITDCALDISHDHELGENWFFPVDFPEVRRD